MAFYAVVDVSRDYFWKYRLHFAYPTDQFAEAADGQCMICMDDLNFSHAPDDPFNTVPFLEYLHNASVRGMLTVMFSSNREEINPAIRLQPCGHILCTKCMFLWTLDHPACPACRVALYNPQLPVGPLSSEQVLSLLGRGPHKDACDRPRRLIVAIYEAILVFRWQAGMWVQIIGRLIGLAIVFGFVCILFAFVYITCRVTRWLINLITFRLSRE
jgi:hypothetical protein